MTEQNNASALMKFKFGEYIQGKDDIRYYFRRFELELRVLRITNEADKRDLLLRSMGAHIFKLVNDNFDPVSPDDKTYDELKEFLEDHFKPVTNIHAERAQFAQRFRKHNETISEYVAALRALAVNCKFKTTLDERLRDQLIVGINDSRIQELLFREHATESATLNDVEKSALNYESALRNLKTIESVVKSEPLNNADSINKIDGQKKCVRKEQSFHKIPKSKADTNIKDFTSNNKKFQIDKHKVCIRCGNSKHSAGEKCKAENSICKYCKMKGHFAKVCVKSGRAEFVNHIFYVNSDNRYSVNALINGKHLSLQYDTGSGKSLIPEKFYNSIGKPKLKKAKQLYAYPDKPIITLGEIRVKVTIGSQTRTCTLTVVPGKSIPIFGKDLMKLFEMEPNYSVNYIDTTHTIVETQLVKEYSDIFDESKGGTILCFEARIKLQDDAVPKMCKARPVPYALRNAADKEIDRLVQNGTLEPVNVNEQIVEWASPVVYVVKKNGQIRLCGDFKSTINKYMVTEPYPYPTFEDIVSKLNGCTEFSVVDLKDAFLQVKVHKGDRKYLTIATHRGYYQFCRMPFGIKSAPLIFQKLMDQFLFNMEGVAWFQDDIAVGGSNREEHLVRLRKVFDVFRKVGLKTQTSKLQLFQKEIKFLGHRINKNGILPDNDRIRALIQQPRPTNISELRSFLGSVNYYSRFIRNLQSLCAPLYKLLERNTPWKWSKEHQKAFETLREQISTSVILSHFDPQKPIILSCDASTRGLGAVLQHRIDGKLQLIAAASRTLNTAEKNYSSLDREALAIMFGIQKFYKYLIGNHFIIQSDHKPLERILGNNSEIPRLAASRLTRWAVTLAAFDYEIEHRPGKEMAAPDALSRLPLPDAKISNFEDSSTVYRIVNHTIYELTLTPRTLRSLTLKDPILCKVIQFLQFGWPNKKGLEQKFYPYYAKRNELTYEQNILMLHNRIVIPERLKHLVIEKLHEGHSGIIAMKSVARHAVWWPCIDQDLENTVKSCFNCNEHQPLIAESPLLLWNNTEKPWDRIHIDLAQLNGENWFFVVDSYSRWLEVFKLKYVTSSDIIRCFRKLFATYGICRIIVSDNGPQFTSSEFREFCHRNGIKHIRTTPYHSRSNGLAERVIRTFKTRFKKTQNRFESQEHQLQVFLFTYRTTVHKATNSTPAKLFLNRELPTLFDRLKPNYINDVENLKSKFYHDQTSRTRDFNVGDEVWLRQGPKPTWKPSVITEKTGPLSYRTTNEQRVHADHLRKRDNNLLTRQVSREQEQTKMNSAESVIEDTEHDDQPRTPHRCRSPDMSFPRETTDENSELNTSEQLPTVSEPLRRSSRVRKPPNRFHDQFGY